MFRLFFLQSFNFSQHISTYRKVASSRPVYYSILYSLGQRAQQLSINFPFHKQSKMLGCPTNQDSLLLVTLQYLILFVTFLRIMDEHIMDESMMQNAVISPLEFEGLYIIAKLQYVLQSLYTPRSKENFLHYISNKRCWHQSLQVEILFVVP